MKIDIQLGDTFAICELGNVYQFRNGKCRGIWWKDWHTEGNRSGLRYLDPALARQIITAAGHTIEEVTPSPAPVPWPTHAAVNKCIGVIVATGTLEQCQKYIYHPSDHYEVRPLAPAPLSPAMRRFLDRIWAWAGAAGEDEIADAARNLLAEGGGQ